MTKTIARKVLDFIGNAYSMKYDQETERTNIYINNEFYSSKKYVGHLYRQYCDGVYTDIIYSSNEDLLKLIDSSQLPVETILTI